MTETSRFWGGISTGDAGPYSADEMNEILRYIVGDSSSESVIFKYSGPIISTPGLLVTQTTPASDNVSVGVGTALVHGSFYKNDATVNVAIDANSSGNPRIDTIILEKSWITQTVRIGILKGTPAGSPVAPTLTQTAGSLWQIPLADIAVADSFTTITSSDITVRSNYYPSTSDSLVFDYVNSVGPFAATPGSMVDIHSTLNRTINITNTRVKFTFSIFYTLDTPASSNYFANVYIDGLSAYYQGTEDIFAMSGIYGIASYVGVISGLTPGSNTFRLRHKVTAGYTGSTIRASFILEELAD